MTSVAIKRKALSLKQKLQILERADNSVQSRKDLALDLKIAPETLSGILRQSETIKEVGNGNLLSLKLKKLKSPSNKR